MDLLSPAKRLTQRFPSWLGWLLVLLGNLAVVLWRATPAYLRGSFYVEGGMWWEQVRDKGLIDALLHSRGDYLTVGNILVIQVADALQRAFFPATSAPALQITLSCVYAAVIFTHAFGVIRRYHGAWWAVAGVASMLLLPELGADAVIFGEASNIGYFSALTTVFVIYDAWQRPWTRLGSVIGAAWLLLHMFTSPMAAALVVILGGARVGVYFLRRFWRLEALDSLGTLLGRWVLPVLVGAAYSFWVSQHPSYNSSYRDLLREVWVEKLLARQLLYPLIVGAYTHFNNTLALALGLPLLGALAAWGWISKNAWKGGLDSAARWSAAWLPALAMAAMGGATFFSRQFILRLWGFGYQSTEPDRYYYAQNALMAVFLVITLHDVVKRWPGLRLLVATALVIQLLRFAGLQVDAHQHFRDNFSLEEASKRWPVASLRASQQASLIQNTPPMWPVSVQPPGWKVMVPLTSLAAIPKKIKEAAECEVKRDDRHSFLGIESTKVLAVSNLRVVPVGKEALVLFSAEAEDLPFVPFSKRQLAIGGLADWDKANATFTWMPSSGGVQRKLEKKERGACRVDVSLLWHGTSLDALQASLPKAWCALVLEDDKARAVGDFSSLSFSAGLSSLPGQESDSSWSSSAGARWSWTWKPEQVQATGLKLTKQGLSTEPIALLKSFNESAYLARNPDVRRAVEAGIVKSGRAHFEAFGFREHRGSQLQQATIPVGSGMKLNAVTGLRVALTFVNGPMPAVLSVRLVGESGGERSFRMLPPDQPHGHNRTFAVTDLGLAHKTSTAADEPLKAVQISLDGSQEATAFQITRLDLSAAEPK